MLKDLINKMVLLRKAFSKKRFAELRFISNSMMDEAALHNDPVKAEIAVIAYALHKLSSKSHISKHPQWQKSKGAILKTIEKSINSLQQGRIKLFEKSLWQLGEKVGSVDDYLGNYVQSTIDKARVKQASSAYAHGLSMSQAAELTGADIKKVQSYVGITKIHDEDKYALNIKQRLKNLQKALGASK